MSDMYEVKTAVEYEKGGEKKTRWVRVGVGFPLRNGNGFSILLDALPVNGKLVMMPPREREESGGSQPF